MVETGYPPFNRTVDKTNRVLHEIEEACGSPHATNPPRAGHSSQRLEAGWRPANLTPSFTVITDLQMRLIGRLVGQCLA